jgi:RhoGAP domain
MSALYKKEPFAFDDPNNYIDISAITSALKQFLRDLPEPLIISGLYNELIAITRV